MYGDHSTTVRIKSLSVPELHDVMYAAEKYDIVKLKAKCIDSLRRKLKTRVCVAQMMMIYEISRFFEIPELEVEAYCTITK
jgi:hypothetical protein